MSREYDAYFNRFVERFDADEVVLLAIDSNAYEDATIADALAERDLDFPVLRDAGNEIADAYGASTTPHVFVVTGRERCASVDTSMIDRGSGSAAPSWTSR